MVYSTLIVLTVLSYSLLEGVWVLDYMPKNYAEICVVLLAFVKVALVTEYFMELHYSPNWLRTIMFAWIFAVAFSLVYFIATRSVF